MHAQEHQPDRRNPDDPTEVLPMTVANSRVAMGGTDGTITLEVSASDTAGLIVGDGVYDIELTDSLG